MKRFLSIGLVLALSVSAGVAGDRRDFQRPDTIPFPTDRPYSLLTATLGKMLYFDPRLSGGQNMNCASCHDPSFGWETPVAGAIGSHNEPLGRHAPTILNMAWVDPYFWDGRAATLEEQAAGPITAPVEMNAKLDEVIARLNELDTYVQGFNQAFPQRGLTAETLLIAIATYERTVVSGWAPFDRWVEGDETAISDSAKRGFNLFTGKAHCADCHSGWNMTDNQFHDIGLYTEDIGRAAIEPDNPLARYAFKTPGLRNIGHRAPFMHNGETDDLETVIYHYVSGGIERSSLSPLIRPLDLTEQDVSDLIAFLHALTAEEASVPAPILPTN